LLPQTACYNCIFRTFIVALACSCAAASSSDTRLAIPKAKEHKDLHGEGYVQTYLIKGAAVQPGGCQRLGSLCGCLGSLTSKSLQCLLLSGDHQTGSLGDGTTTVSRDVVSQYNLNCLLLLSLESVPMLRNDAHLLTHMYLICVRTKRTMGHIPVVVSIRPVVLQRTHPPPSEA
jgi:hypothetical protein